MKKIMLFAAIAVCLMLLASCGCEHEYDWTVLKAATCTESGEREGTCSLCGNHTKETVPAGHVIVEVEALEPTCLKKGNTAGSSCSLCGEVFLEMQVLPALGHIYSEWEATKKAHTHSCVNCGKTQTLAHTFESGIKVCKTCNYTEVVPTPTKDTEYEVENLGNITRTIYLRMNGGGYRNDGTPVLYTVSDGNPIALFVMLNAETGKIILEKELKHSSGAWEVFVHSSKDVYIVAHGKPYLYIFDHETEEIKEVGSLPAYSSLGQVMCEGKDGMVYSGSTDSGYYWGYDPKTGRFTTMPALITNATRYPAVAYDKKENKLYVSVISKDSKNYLFRVDPETRKKEDITPAEYKNNAKYQFYDMMVCGDILVIRYPSTQETIFFNIREDKLVAFNQEGKTGAGNVMKTYVRQPALDPEDDTRFYTVVNNKLAIFDTKTLTYKITNVSANTQMIRMVFLKLDQEKYPGYSACSLYSHKGQTQFINIEKNKVVALNTDISGGMNEGNCLTITDSDLLIVGGGYGGSTGVYDIEHGTKKTYEGIGQQEGVGAYGSMVFLGSYPNSVIHKATPTATSFTYTSILNMGKNSSVSGYNNQDRPYNFLPVYEKGVMVVASIPAQNFTTGALAIFDPNTNAQKYFKKFPVQDQSAASLAYSNGTLFMGTTTRAGYGTSAKATQAVLVAMNMDTYEHKTYTLPFIAGAITALCTDTEGKIWGMGWDNLFCFDPAMEKFVYNKKINIACANATWRDIKMSLGGDGSCIFISSATTMDFYRYDIKADKLDVIAENVGWYHVGDSYGNFYFLNGINVNKLTFKY